MNRFRFCKMFLAISILFVCRTYGQTIDLEQAVETAVKNNPQLLSQMQKVKAAGALTWDRVSPENPQLFWEVEGIPKSASSFTKFEGKKIGVAQSLSLPWIYVMRGVKQNQAKNAAHAEYLQLKNQVVADLKKQFYQTLLYKEKINLFSELVDLNQDHLQKARIRVMAGEASPYDTMKAKVDWMDARNQKLGAEQESFIALKKLKIIMGVDLASDLSVSGRLTFKPVQFNLDTLYQRVEEKHPLLQKAYAILKQKRIERSLSWMHLLPDVHVKYFQQSFSGNTSPSAWGGEIGIQVPLWFFTKGQGTIRHATYQLRAEEIQYAAQKRKITLGIDEAVANMTVSEKQVINYEKNALQEVNELVRIAKRSYEEGEMGSLEVSEALRSMIRVQIGYYEAIFRNLSALADLEVSVGGNTFPVTR